MTLWRRIRFLFRQNRFNSELDEEMRLHAELRAELLREQGATPEEAVYAARSRFGNATLLKEVSRDMWGTNWIEDFWKDLRFAARQMRKAPGFTLVAVLTLGLGIGANTAIFTLIDAVLLKSLPVRDPAHLLLLGNIRSWGVVSGQSGSFSVFSYELYRHLRDDTGIFEGLCAFQSNSRLPVAVRRPGSETAQPASAKLVSGNYFSVLGITTALGRPIAPSDDSASASPVAVVSYRYWKEKLNQDLSIAGATIELSGVPVTIAGVAPAGFYGDTLETDPPNFWLPLSADRLISRQSTVIDSPDDHWLFAMGRLKPGVSKAQAEARLTTALRAWLNTRPIPAAWRGEMLKSYIELTPGGSGITHMQRRYSETLRLLLALAALVLLITCSNLANLLLARATARNAESSVRLALGASRGRLFRQSLTESLSLAFLGAGLAVFFASAGTEMLITLVFRGADYVPIRSTPDLRVLAFTLGVAFVAALGFGLLPALRITRAEIAPVLKAGSRSLTGGPLAHRRFGLGNVLIVGQIALSLVLLAGAGLFARSLSNLSSQQFGFERQHVLTVSVDPVLAGYEYNQLAPLYQRLYSRLNGLAGVASASFSLYSPFNNCCWSSGIVVPGYVPQPKENVYALWNVVSPRYFETIGTRLILGRAIDQRDTPNSRLVAVVTDAFVRHYFPGGSPIGKHFRFNEDRHPVDLEIVGVVENAKYDSPREEPSRMAFLPLLQARAEPGEPPQSAKFRSSFIHAIEVRAAGDPSGIARELRQAMAEVDPKLTVLKMNTMSDQIGRTLNQENVVAQLAAFFGLLALVLACVGLYGLMAYAVERRTSEIGIRMALGAHRRAVTGMVIREVLLQGVIGILIGVPAALAGGRLIANQLYETKPADPVTSGSAAILLLACVLLAGYLPARRASRIDPLRALRHE